MTKTCKNDAIHVLTERSKGFAQVCTQVGEDEALEWLNARHSVKLLCCRFGLWKKETRQELAAEPCRTHLERTHYVFKR